MECGKTERDQHFTESKEQLLHFRRSCLRFPVSSGMDSSSVWNMDQIMCRYCHMYTDCFIFFTRTFMCRFDPLPGATNNIRGAHTMRIAASGVQKRALQLLCVPWLLVRSSQLHHLQGKRRKAGTTCESCSHQQTDG